MAKLKPNAKTPWTELKNDADTREYLFTLMKWYAASAKTYTQIAIAALVLPIAFAQRVLGATESARVTVDAFVLLSWVMFLIAVGCGLLYQWLAPRYVEIESEQQEANWIQKYPGYVFGAMLVAFYCGAVLFMIGAYLRLQGHG